MTSVIGDVVNGVTDATTEESSCEASSEQRSSSETSTFTPPAISAATIKHEQLGDGNRMGDCKAQDSEDVDCESQDRTGVHYSKLALILKLQRDMATMQLQLSNLQDAMRTANATLQQLVQQAFSSD